MSGSQLLERGAGGKKAEVNEGRVREWREREEGRDGADPDRTQRNVRFGERSRRGYTTVESGADKAAPAGVREEPDPARRSP